MRAWIAWIAAAAALTGCVQTKLTAADVAQAIKVAESLNSPATAACLQGLKVNDLNSALAALESPACAQVLAQVTRIAAP
jgi:hypothetical protein